METAPDLWHSLLDCSNSESTLVVCLCGGGSTSCVHPASLTWICYIKVKSVQGGGGGGMTVTNADTTLPYWHRYTLRARPAAVSVCILSCSSQVALKTNDNLSISLFVCCLFFLLWNCPWCWLLLPLKRASGLHRNHRTPKDLHTQP